MNKHGGNDGRSYRQMSRVQGQSSATGGPDERNFPSFCVYLPVSFCDYLSVLSGNSPWEIKVKRNCNRVLGFQSAGVLRSCRPASVSPCLPLNE